MRMETAVLSFKNFLNGSPNLAGAPAEIRCAGGPFFYEFYIVRVTQENDDEFLGRDLQGIQKLPVGRIKVGVPQK